jgi:hypothetical protein
MKKMERDNISKGNSDVSWRGFLLGLCLLIALPTKKAQIDSGLIV